MKIGAHFRKTMWKVGSKMRFQNYGKSLGGRIHGEPKLTGTELEIGHPKRRWHGPAVELLGVEVLGQVRCLVTGVLRS